MFMKCWITLDSKGQVWVLIEVFLLLFEEVIDDNFLDMKTLNVI